MCLMTEQQYAIDEDLREAEAMVKGLVPYLESDEVYGRVGGGGIFGGGSMPALTAGALVMRLRRLRLLRDQMTESQRARLDSIEDQHAEAVKEWRVHYERKLLREANSRLDAMRAFFQEASENPRTTSSNYRPEVLRRTISQEILIALADMNVSSQELAQKASQVDNRLRGIATQATDFLWSPMLQPIYPQKDFWWLYRKPRDQ
jgi:hypothetical protein